MKEGVTSNVASIDVEVNRPEDRSAKQNKLRSNQSTPSISGSGSTGTIVTNRSAGDWFLRDVTAHALGVSNHGVVQVKINIRDSSDNTVTTAIMDVTDGKLDFGGHVVKPGWDVQYNISQNDSSSYNVELYPIFRKPDPSDTDSGGSIEDDPGDNSVEDFERSSPLNDYTGDTGEFTVTTTEPYYNSNSLAYDTSTTGGYHTVVTDSLDNQPSEPYTLKCRIRSQAADSDGSGEDRLGFVIGANSSGEGIRATFRPERDTFYIAENEGSTSTLASDSSAYSYPGDEWLTIQLSQDNQASPTTEAKLIRPSDNKTLSTLTTDYETVGSYIGFYANKNSSGDDHYFDYVTEV